MFHFRVRNGTGWGHWAMTTRFLLDAYLSLFAVTQLTWLSLPLGLGCVLLLRGFLCSVWQADIRVAMCVGFQVLRFL